MDKAIVDLFNVDVMLKPRYWVVELCGDGVTGQIVECQIHDMVGGMDANAGGSLGWQEADCLFALLNGIIAFIIIGWDVVWVRLLVFGSDWHGSKHCRLKYLLGFMWDLQWVVGVLIAALVVG